MSGAHAGLSFMDLTTLHDEVRAKERAAVDARRDAEGAREKLADFQLAARKTIAEPLPLAEYWEWSEDFMGVVQDGGGGVRIGHYGLETGASSIPLDVVDSLLKLHLEAEGIGAWPSSEA